MKAARLLFYQFIILNTKRRKFLTALSCVVVFCTVYALIIPAITMSKSNPTLAAERTQGAPGETLTVQVSAEADNTQEERVFLLSATGDNAGLDDGYVFDEYGVTNLLDDNGKTIELHRDLQADGTLDYWFQLSAGESTQFSLLLSNGTSQLVEQTDVEPEDTEEPDVDKDAGDVSNDTSGIEPANQTTEPSPMQFVYADGDKSVSGALKFYAASAATLAEARESLTRKLSQQPDADAQFAWSEQVAAEETEEEEVTAEEMEEEKPVEVETADEPETEEATDEPQEESAQTEKTTEKKSTPNKSKGTADATETVGTQFLSSKGNTYDVTVTYGPEAKIPEGATLKLTEYAEDSEKYKEARNAILGVDYSEDDADSDYDQEILVDDSGEVPLYQFRPRPVFADGENGEAVGMDAFDISIVDARGNKVEPKASVQVSIVMKSLPEDADAETLKSSMGLQHLDESSGEIVVETVASVDANVDGEIEVTETAVKAEFSVDSFSTYSFTWNYGYYEYRSAVHYGYMDGSNFVEFANGIPNQRPTFTSSPAYLIYDVDGYEYSYTYRGSSSNRIQPILLWSNNFWRYTSDGSSWGYLSNNNNRSEDLYVVYTPKKEPVQGGTVKAVTGDTTPPAEPDILKESTDNGDGTRTLSLSIIGHSKPLEASKLADVIVVFDVSGSMNDNMAGNSTSNNNQRRLQIAKNAVNNLADTLLAKTNSAGQKLIRMSLISFSNDATTVQGFTDNPTTFKNAVNGLSANGGTNWEAALRMANNMSVDPDRATFVIFVSDGDPTFRKTRGNLSNSNLDVYTNNNSLYYRTNTVFGTGSSDNDGRNYNAALTEAQSIVSHNKNFYTIGISNDVSNMAQLNSDAGGKANYSATTSAQLTQAFDEIAASITATLGWGNVNLIDGITGLTNLTAKASIVGVDSNSFQYYKNSEDWDPTSEGANLATYNEETGAVEWNMGETFQLEDGVTYKVEFLVWPSQTAIDYVTHLNNQEITYDELPDDVKSQIQQVGNTYTLKTNTENAKATYYQSTKSGDSVNVDGYEHSKDFQTVDPLGLNTMTLSVEKKWTDELTGGEDRETLVSLYLQRRKAGTDDEFEDFAVPYIDPDGNRVVSNVIKLSAANNWKATFYTPPGLIASGTTYNSGYEFRVTEPNQDYHYELNGEIIKPMLVDLVKTYVGDTDGNESLTAENIVKGGINVAKVVKDIAGNEVKPDEEFTIKGYILDPNGNPYTFDTSWDDRTDTSSSTGSAGWQTHQNDPIAYHLYDQDGTRIGYKLHFASTGEIELKLKGGQSVRFINVPQGCTYQFYEVIEGMTEGYEFVSAEGKNQKRATPGGDFVDMTEQPTVSGNTVSGVVYGNAQHNVTFTNTMKFYEVELVKVDTGDADKKLNGAEFELYADVDYTTKATNIDGEEIGSLTTGGFEEDGKTPKGFISIGKLAEGTYYLVETKAPNGYHSLEQPIRLTVGALGITAFVDPSSILTVTTNDDGVSTVTVPNSPGYELPETGGTGTRMFELLGAVLMGLGLIGLWRKKMA